MKKHLVLFIILVQTQWAFSQISLTTADLAGPGDVVYETTVDLNNLIPIAGTNENYELLAITNTEGLDTTYYLNAASTPFGSAMQGANLASLTGKSYTYFEKDATGLYARGSVFNTDGFPINLPFTAAPLRFSSRLPILTFPATMGMNLKAAATTRFTFRYDTVVPIGPIQANVDSVRIIGNITDTSIIDGFGTAQFQGGNFECLRNIQTLKIVFSAQVRASLFGTPTWLPFPTTLPDFYSQQLLLWTNDYKAPLLTISYDENGDFIGSKAQLPLVSRARTLVSSIPDFDFTPYPNPATNSFSIQSEKILKKVKLFSPTGKEIFEITPSSPGETIKTGKLPRGIYIVQTESKDGSISRKKLIINQ